MGRHCVQSFVSFTENKERTFVLYRGSQHLHQDYFNITNTVTPNDWCVLNPRYLEGLDYRQEFLQLFGFEVDGVDYDADVDPAVTIAQLVS